MSNDSLDEVDSNNMLGEADAVLSHRNVLGIYLVRIERSAISEDDNESGVVRPRRVDNIRADYQTHDAIDVVQSAQPTPMVFAFILRNIRPVLETDNVGQHEVKKHTPSRLKPVA